MIQEKRIRKAPKPYMPSQWEIAKKDKAIEKKRRFTLCEYQMIPPPLKYNSMTETLLLPGVNFHFLS